MKLHEFISNSKAEVLRRCLGRLKSDHPDRSDEALLNGLPSFVDEVVRSLRRNSGLEEAESDERSAARIKAQSDAATSRGTTRRSQGFEIGRVVRDYGLVCEMVNQVAEEQGLLFDSTEHKILNVSIDDATAIAIEAFAAGTADAVRAEKVELFGFLAHEIKNAVGSAALAFDLIRLGRVAPDGSTAEIVRRALWRIRLLATQTLADAQLRSGVQTRTESVRLADLFAEVVSESAPERGIRIEVQVDPALVVDADPRLLVSAVGNLVHNGLKFTRDGGTVVLRATATGGSVAIEVEDHCGGLSEGTAEALFQPFTQGSPARGGVGLGLTIARRAVEAHGGTLSVRNLPGAACVFRIELPRQARVKAA